MQISPPPIPSPVNDSPLTIYGHFTGKLRQSLKSHWVSGDAVSLYSYTLNAAWLVNNSFIIRLYYRGFYFYLQTEWFFVRSCMGISNLGNIYIRNNLNYAQSQGFHTIIHTARDQERGQCNEQDCHNRKQWVPISDQSEHFCICIVPIHSRSLSRAVWIYHIRERNCGLQDVSLNIDCCWAMVVHLQRHSIKNRSMGI